METRVAETRLNIGADLRGGTAGGEHFADAQHHRDVAGQRQSYLDVLRKDCGERLRASSASTGFFCLNSKCGPRREKKQCQHHNDALHEVPQCSSYVAILTQPRVKSVFRFKNRFKTGILPSLNCCIFALVGKNPLKAEQKTAWKAGTAVANLL